MRRTLEKKICLKSPTENSFQLTTQLPSSNINQQSPLKKQQNGLNANNHHDQSANFGCPQWILSKCFNQRTHTPSFAEQSLPHLSQLHPSKNIDNSITKHHSVTKNHKLKVVSCGRKSAQTQIINLPTFSKLKNLNKKEQPFVSFQKGTKQKLQQIMETKRCTNVYPSPALSVDSSDNKGKESSLQQSLNRKNSCLNRKSSGMKINLSLSLLQKSVHQPQIKKSVEVSKNWLGPQSMKREYPSISKSLMQHQLKPIAINKKSFIYQSSNQFNIIDPLNDMKSLNTEYLKQKIAFSQQISQKQTIHDHCNSPIIIIGSNNPHNQRKPHQKSFQTPRNVTINFIEVENESQLGSNIMNEDSFVLQRGIEQIFHATLQKPNQAMFRSMIVHDSVENNGQEFWQNIYLASAQTVNHQYDTLIAPDTGLFHHQQ